jgi:hypothetical protein
MNRIFHTEAAGAVGVSYRQAGPADLAPITGVACFRVSLTFEGRIAHSALTGDTVLQD